MDQVNQNIDDFSKSEIARLKAERKRLDRENEEAAKAASSAEPTPQPVDVYQRNQDRIRSVNNKKFPKGSSAIVNMAVASLVDGNGSEGLARGYSRAKEDVSNLMARGERGRASVRRQQYMEEYFLPAVEIVVNSTSPDEVLNSKKALDELDKYVLLEGSGKGYTASYIRQAYGNQLGQAKGRSDDSVRSGVCRINALLDEGEVRSAFGLASALKKRVDEGGAQADDEDYDLLGRIVAYYS